jgi:hypothetical protein
MRNFIIFCSLLFSGSLFGQGIMRSAIGCMGTPMVQNQVSFQSIAGQSSLTVNRHGFIQPTVLPAKTPSRTLVAMPNPTRNFITIQGLSPSDVVSLVDVSGRHVVSLEVVNRELVLDLSSYKSGIYTAHVQSAFVYTPIKIIKVE